jgi:hypothetical protein
MLSPGKLRLELRSEVRAEFFATRRGQLNQLGCMVVVIKSRVPAQCVASFGANDGRMSLPVFAGWSGRNCGDGIACAESSLCRCAWCCVALQLTASRCNVLRCCSQRRHAHFVAAKRHGLHEALSGLSGHYPDLATIRECTPPCIVHREAGGGMEGC